MDIYIDESGSIHPSNEKLNRYFIIGMILPRDKYKLVKSYRLFVRKNLEILKKLDTKHKMFDSFGRFKELKGACFNREIKLKFMEFFCRDQSFQVGYIILDNNKLQKKFISNKARTFNYLLRIFLTNALQRGYIVESKIFLNIDERNVRTESKFSLEDYLNQELVLNLDSIENIEAKYFDSSNNQLIQVADVFSNIMYSNIVTRGAYKKELEKLRQAGYILPLFQFPK